MATYDHPRLIPKAWVNFDGTGTVAITDDENVASITDNAVGDWTINFSASLVDANYAVQVSGLDTNVFTASSQLGVVGRPGGGITAITKSTSAFRVGYYSPFGTAGDYDNVWVAFYGGP